jgi:hypothetical protein
MHVKHLNVTELMLELDYQGPRKDAGNQRSKEKQTVGDALLFLSSEREPGFKMFLCIHIIIFMWKLRLRGDVSRL